jgi:hypothetical protein
MKKRAHSAAQTQGRDQNVEQPATTMKHDARVANCRTRMEKKKATDAE